MQKQKEDNLGDIVARTYTKKFDVLNKLRSVVVLRTNVASVGSVFNDTRKVKVLALPKIDVSSEGPSSDDKAKIDVSSEGPLSKRRFLLYRFRQ